MNYTEQLNLTKKRLKLKIYNSKFFSPGEKKILDKLISTQEMLKELIEIEIKLDSKLDELIKIINELK